MALFLIPGATLHKVGRGLPNGEIKFASKNDFLELTEEHEKHFGDSFGFLKSKGKIVDDAGKKALEKALEAGKKDNSKSDKRVALEKEATELGLEFDDKTSQKDLSALIDAKKAEETK